MISGKEIIRQVDNGNIKIDPFDYNQASPHSYDLRLAPLLLRVVPNATLAGQEIIDTHIGGSGHYEKLLENGAFLLQPGQLYLGCTIEVIGSNYFGGVLHGRSTSARQGIIIHSAGFIDCGWFGQVTLEIVNVTNSPLMLYPHDRVCQVEWNRIEGDVELYKSTYQGQTGPTPAKSLAD